MDFQGVIATLSKCSRAGRTGTQLALATTTGESPTLGKSNGYARIAGAGQVSRTGNVRGVVGSKPARAEPETAISRTCDAPAAGPVQIDASRTSLDPSRKRGTTVNNRKTWASDRELVDEILTGSAEHFDQLYQA